MTTETYSEALASRAEHEAVAAHADVLGRAATLYKEPQNA